MIKKISVILVFVLVLSFSLTCFAQENQFLTIGQVSGAMPMVTVELIGSNFNSSDISATMNSKSLKFISANKYNEKVNSACTYILVDLSTSMRDDFLLVKDNIKAFINSCGKNHKIVLITFGENKVNTVVSGTDNKEEISNAVDNLKPNEKGTVFYEALSYAYQMYLSDNGNYDREYVLAFSDGIDEQIGKTTYAEVLAQYEKHSLPVYAVCSKDTSKAASDKFGQLARTSGGSIAIVENGVQFKAFSEKINDVTIASFEAESNRVSDSEDVVRVEAGSLHAECKVMLTKSAADTIHPVVDVLTYNSQKNVFTIRFSEKVIGADLKSAYVVKDKTGNPVAIANVKVIDSTTFELTLQNKTKNGNYIFEFSGITDNSVEQNIVQGTKTVNVENAPFSVSPWVIVILVFAVLAIVGIIIVITIVNSRKKKEPEEQDNELLEREINEIEYVQNNNTSVKHHIVVADSVSIKLLIKTGKTVEQKIVADVVSSLIVGRSNICDVCVDDPKMSRQHFVIENDDNNIYITDLQSHNGTRLNGTKISSRQLLSEGDKISAGLSDIYISKISR